MEWRHRETDYFIIKNIKVQYYGSMATFVDFWILATEIESQGDYQRLE